MKTRADKIDRIVLWVILAGGFLSLLFYALTSFLAQPTVETITTNAPSVNSAGNNNSAQEIKFQPRKSK